MRLSAANAALGAHGSGTGENTPMEESPDAFVNGNYAFLDAEIMPPPILGVTHNLGAAGSHLTYAHLLAGDVWKVVLTWIALRPMRVQ